jgi:hypothetical protein
MREVILLQYECLLPFLPGNGARKELDVYALLFL